VRDIDAVDMRCGHNVEKGEASTAHRLLRTASTRTRVRLAVSPIPINRKPRRFAGVDFMHTVIACLLRLFSSPQRPCWQLRCLRTEALAFVKLARVYNNLGKTTWACLGRYPP
jgi:hypothetical protein